MTLKSQEVANFGMCFHVICKLFILFMFVYDKNKDTPFCTGSMAWKEMNYSNDTHLMEDQKVAGVFGCTGI